MASPGALQEPVEVLRSAGIAFRVDLKNNSTLLSSSCRARRCAIAGQLDVVREQTQSARRVSASGSGTKAERSRIRIDAYVVA